MHTNNIHFELAQLLRQFPLVDLLPWYPKSFLQSEADELLLGYFISLADPVWIAEQLEQPLIDVQLQLSLIATRLSNHKAQYNALLPELQAIDQFLRWPLSLFPLPSHCKTPLLAYGNTFGEVLLELQRREQTLFRLEYSSSACREAMRSTFRKHSCMYLVERLHVFRFPPPAELERGPDHSLFQARNSN